MSEPKFHADYRCIDELCEHRWQGIVGPVQCPKCGCLHVAWLDFDKWEQQGAGFMPKPEYYDDLLVPPTTERGRENE